MDTCLEHDGLIVSLLRSLSDPGKKKNVDRMKHKTFNHVYLSAFFKCISYYDYFTSPGLFLLSLEDEWNLNLTGLQLIHVGEQ